MLVHICCSVDSHYFLQRLRALYPAQRIIGYFYDPNIHPYSEFLMRYFDVKRSCKKLGVKLICGEYDYEAWLEGSRGLEKEPEKGSRCAYCFDFRVENSAQKALELGCKKITTTLLMSPKKDFSQLEKALNKAVEGKGLEVVAHDFRKAGGTNEQFSLAKKDKLYHQNYCGCIFGLLNQRKDNEIIEELCEPLGGQVQPASIKARLKLYKKLRKYERNGISFSLLREKILNYRLKFARISLDSKVIASYFLFYSHFRRENLRFSCQGGLGLINLGKDDVKLLSLELFNELGKFSYKSVSDLIKNPPKLKSELRIRKALSGQSRSLSPIIVLDSLEAGKYELWASSIIYPDSIERIIKNPQI